MPIRVEIELDTGGLESGIVRANTRLDQLQNHVSDTITSIRRIDGESRSFLSTLRDVTVIVGQAGFAMENLHRISTGWVGEIVKLNAEVERMSSLLKAMSTAADPVKEASDYIRNLREEAKQAPFSLQAMHQAFIRMKAGGLDPAKGSMQALVDAVAAFGGTDETLGRASLAFQEMAGKGVVQMKELRNQLGMAIPQAMNLMARSFGVTYQQLMEDVHTGTVVAKDAIESLNLEFERVYGGAAQRQMETFNGQLARFKVIMMGLAIKAGGADDNENGFFGTLKTQFKEFNDMMSGETGQVLAGQLGAGLTQTVLYLRQAVEAAIEFRGVIIAAGEALLAGFAGQAIIYGFTGLRAAIVGVTESLALMRIQWALVSESFIAGNTAAAATGMFSAVGASLTALAGVLPMVVGGLALVAQYFDLAGSKAKDALEEIRKFGAFSRDQVDKAKENPQQLEASLARLVKLKESGSAVAPSIDGEIARLQREINQANQIIATGESQVNREAARRATMQTVERLNEETAAIRRRYFEEGNAAADAYKQQVAAYNESRKSTADIQKKYQDENRERAKREYDLQIELLDRYIVQEQALLAKGNDQQKVAADEALKELTRRRDEQIELRRKEVERGRGTPKEEKALKDDALFARGEKYLEKVKAQAEGAKAAIIGLDEDVYALLARTKDADFIGDTAIEKVRQLADEMVRAKQEAEDFQKIANAKKQWDTDFENVYVKSRQDALDSAAKLNKTELSDLDKLIEKRRAGFYAGYGDVFTEEQKRFKQMRESVEGIGAAAKASGETIRTELFGNPTATAAETFADAMNKAARSILTLGDAARGVPLVEMLGGARQGSPFTAMGVGAPKGGNYYDILTARESSNNPNAANPNSSAVGLGQFIRETWLEFIAKARPDLANLNEQQKLALRTNVDLAKQAIQWLTQSNGDKLIKGGYQATDANVYMAHFLGIEGAMKVLSASSDKIIASLPGMQKAVGANPSMLGGGKTVGQFRSELEGRFGTDMSWLDGVVGSDQRAQYVQIRQNEAATRANNINQATQKYLQNLKDLQDSAKLIEEGANKNLAKAIKWIRERTDGGSTDLNNSENLKIIREARQLDLDQAKQLTAQKARTSANSAQSAMADAVSKSKIGEEEAYQNFLLDPQSVKANQAFIRAKQAGTERLDRMRSQAGYDMPAEEMRLQEQLTAIVNEEVFKQIGATKLKSQEISRALMVESDARQDAYNKEIERINSLVAAYQGSEERKAQIVEQAEAYKVKLREQLAVSEPLGRQFREMGNIADNFERTIGGALNGTIDNFSNMMTGMKINWKNTLQSMARDFAAMFLRGVIGRALGFGFGQMGGLGGLLGGGQPMQLVGGMHGGGLVGAEASFMRHVPMSLFAGAPRFHQGGMIGPGEVPIIAKKGEGVFTPQQMAAMGAGAGGQGVSVSMPITVNAQGGDPQQNADMAKRVGQQVESIARGVVVDEIRKQMRPGAQLYSRYNGR